MSRSATVKRPAATPANARYVRHGQGECRASRSDGFPRRPHVQKPPGHRDHLDRVERGEDPLQGVRARLRVAGHQRFGLLREVQETRAAHDELELTIGQKGNLTGGLTCQVVRTGFAEGNGPEGTGKPCLFAGPSRSQVADEAARDFGDPVQGPDREFLCHAPVLTRSTPKHGAKRCLPVLRRLPRTVLENDERAA